MKRVIPDITEVLTARFISGLARLRKFVRYWGKTTINGVEVFTPRKYYYPDMDESTKKVTKQLDIYDQVKVKPEGVRSAWLFLNADKAQDSAVNWDKTILSNNFNTAMTQELSCSLVIGPKVNKGKQTPADITTPVSDQAGLIAEIKSKYLSLWNGGYSFFSSEDDPYLALLTMYLLRSNDIPYSIVAVEETVSSTYMPDPTVMDGVKKADQVKAWRVRFTVPEFLFTSNTDVVNMLVADAQSQAVTPAVVGVKERVQTSTSTATASDGSDEGKPDTVYQRLSTTTSGFWYTTPTGGPGYSVGDKFLRTSILTTPSLNNEEKLNYIFSCLDTGYRKKKRKWYETLIVIIVIIVAVWVAGSAGGSVVAAVGSGAAVTAVVTIAVTITVAALYIALAALAASYLGAQNVALSLGQFLRAVAPLVQIASVISVIASIYSVLRKSVEQAATEAAREGAQASLTSMAGNVVSTVIESVTGLTKLSDITMSHVTKMLSFTFNIYQDMEMRDLQREMNNYRREIAALAEAEEKSKTSDIVKDLMASYTNVLAGDWSYYSELYDRPYEWWATPYHTGNIQATTVNALWLNDPKNAILYNNFTGET